MHSVSALPLLEGKMNHFKKFYKNKKATVKVKYWPNRGHYLLFVNSIWLTIPSKGVLTTVNIFVITIVLWRFKAALLTFQGCVGSAHFPHLWQFFRQQGSPKCCTFDKKLLQLWNLCISCGTLKIVIYNFQLSQLWVVQENVLRSMVVRSGTRERFPVHW
jgi:hypothetical protein